MSVLLKDIKQIDEGAASALECAGLRTDSELQSLTRADLLDLFPGPEYFKRRKTIFDMIHKRKPIDVVMTQLRDFIPHDYLRAALTTDGALVDYLNILKDMKTQMNNVQYFLDAHISLLEDVSKSQPPQDRDQGSLRSTSVASGLEKLHSNQTSNHPQQTQGRSGSSFAAFLSHPQKRQVTYKMIVSGKTFGAHHQLLDKVKISGVEADLVLLNQEESQNSQDCQIVIVFCPVVSRVGTDVATAMKKVTGPEPVILVLMHHTHEAKHVTSLRTWNSCSNIVLHVHVFYHETVNGLLPCQQNDAAICEIRQELMKHCIQRTGDTSGNVDAESGSTGFRDNLRYGNENKGSGLIFRKWW